MSEYTITTSSGVFSLKQPAYICQKHGIVNDGSEPLILRDPDGNRISRHCIKCYQAWISANIVKRGNFGGAR